MRCFPVPWEVTDLNNPIVSLGETVVGGNSLTILPIMLSKSGAFFGLTFVLMQNPLTDLAGGNLGKSGSLPKEFPKWSFIDIAPRPAALIVAECVQVASAFWLTSIESSRCCDRD